MPEVMAHTGKIKLLVILLSFQHPFRNDVMRKRRFSPFQSLKEDFGTSDEETTLGEPGVGDKYARGCPLGSQQNLGAGNSFPHPEEISSLLQTPLWKKLKGHEENLPPNTQRVNLEAREQEMTFLLAVSIQPRIKTWAL